MRTCQIPPAHCSRFSGFSFDNACNFTAIVSNKIWVAGQLQLMTLRWYSCFFLLMYSRSRRFLFLPNTWQMFLRTANFKKLLLNRCGFKGLCKTVLTVRWSWRNQASELLCDLGFLRSGLIACLHSPYHDLLEIPFRFRMDSFLSDSR